MTVDPNWKPVWAQLAGYIAPDGMVFVADAGGAFRGFKEHGDLADRQVDPVVGDVVYVDEGTPAVPLLKHGVVSGVFEDQVWIKFYADSKFGQFHKSEVKKS